MYKHFAFFVRQEGMSHKEFIDYWQTNHTPIIRAAGVARYHTVLPTDPESAEFNGLAGRFEELEALYDAVGSEGSRDYDPDCGKAKEAREDVEEYLVLEKRPRFIGQKTIQKYDT